MSRSSSRIVSRYAVYCSVISAIGMSVISTSLMRIRCSRRYNGPLNAAIATGGRALSVGVGSSAITSSSLRLGGDADGRPDLFHRLFGGRSGRGVARMEHVAHDVRRRCDELVSLPPERLESGVEVADEVLLAVHTAPRGRAALAVHDLHLGRWRVELVEWEKIAVVGIARVLASRARGVRDHGHDLVPDGVCGLGDADRVVVRLGHLPAVDAVDPGRRRGE